MIYSHIESPVKISLLHGILRPKNARAEIHFGARMGRAKLIQVRLFGHPNIDGPAAGKIFPSRGYCLLALLALAPAQKLTRAEAAAQLWENDETQANLSNMRQLVSRMGKSIPGLATVLGVDEKSVWLVDGDKHVDLCQYLNHGNIEAGQGLERLLALYRGDLLEGVEITTEPMRNNLALARTFLRDRFFSLAEDALKTVTRYGITDMALLRRTEMLMLALDSSREDSYRALIAAYGAVGRPEDARRLYRALAKILRLEGEAGPMLETRSSLARATAQVIHSKTALFAQPVSNNRVVLPRIALLAPRWIAGAPGNENILPALIEDTANELARCRNFATLAAHSSFLVKHDGGLIADNEALRADYSVSSFVKPGQGLGDLSIRLVSCRSGEIVWSGEFHLKPDLLINSFRSLVGRIASELSVAVEGDALQELERTGKSSAYLHFLRAQDILKNCDLRNVRRARKAYMEAIKEDEKFAEPYSGVSCSLYLEWLLLGGNDPKLLADARALADMAIDRSPLSSAGHWRKAMVGLYQRDFDKAEQSFQRARDLHPNSADIMLDHGDALGFVGDANEAWGLFESALDLNPTPPDHYWWAGASIAFSKADYSKAIELCGKLASEEAVLRLLAASHGQLGNKAEAREYAERLLEAYPGETAESMTRLQPHRSKESLQTFIDGLRMAGIK